MKKKLIRNIVIAVFIGSIFYGFMGNKSKNIIIEVDGMVIERKTTEKRVGQAIKEANINLNDNDKLNCKIEDKIKNNQKIVINRVLTKSEEVIEPIEFNEVIVKDYKTPVGESRVVSEGVQGQNKRFYTVTYEDGNEVNKVLNDEEVLSEPVDRVIAEGIFEADSLTVCVNKSRQLPSTYQPSDLVLPNVRSANSNNRLYMRKEAAGALEELFKKKITIYMLYLDIDLIVIKRVYIIHIADIQLHQVLVNISLD